MTEPRRLGPLGKTLLGVGFAVAAMLIAACFLIRGYAVGRQRDQDRLELEAVMDEIRSHEVGPIIVEPDPAPPRPRREIESPRSYFVPPWSWTADEW